MSAPWRRILLVLLLALAAGLRFWGLRFGLPFDLARPDEEKIILAALHVAGGDPNPHLFLYPSLYIYLVAAAYRVVFALAGTTVTAAAYAAHAVSDPSLLHVVPRAITAAAGAATIPILYAAAREVFPTRVALGAAALLAVAYLHVRDAHFGTTDVPVALACVAAWWAAVRGFVRGATASGVVVMGVLAGLAVSTKYNAIVVVAPALVAIARPALEARRRPTRREILLACLLLACVVLAFAATTPFAWLDRPAFLAQFGEQRRIFAGIQNGSIIGPARAAFGGERGWVHYATFTLPHGVGLPLVAAALAGCFWLALGRPLVALLALSFPLAWYASMGMGQLVYARNMVPIVPFACLAAAVFAGRAGDLVTRVSRRPRPGAIAGLAILILAALPTAADSFALDRVLARADTRVLGARWVEAHYPSGATLFQTGIFYGHVQPVPATRYTPVAFNSRHAAFFAPDGSQLLPDVVVVAQSPLFVYSGMPSGLEEVLKDHYVLAQMFHARRGGVVGIYDQQDAWYGPFARPGAVERVGPDISIYERRERPAADGHGAGAGSATQ